MLLNYRLEQLQRRQVEKRKAPANPTQAGSSGDLEAGIRTPKRLRSSTADPKIKASQRNPPHILPPFCIICKKVRKCKLNKKTGKKIDLPLQLCETISKPQLVEAAKLKDDEELLHHIQDKDLVSIELRYHHSCILSYVNEARATFGQAPEAETWHLSKGYIDFKQNVIF